MTQEREAGKGTNQTRSLCARTRWHAGECHVLAADALDVANARKLRDVCPPPAPHPGSLLAMRPAEYHPEKDPV